MDKSNGIETTAARVLSEILARLESDKGRPIPWFRVRELCPPFSKPKVYELLKSGRLRAVRLDGIVLVEAGSVEELLRSCDEWKA